MTPNQIVMTDAERDAMRTVTDHARDLHAAGHDIVFTAAVVLDGKVIATARNEVSDTDDPSRHAEVVAIARATKAANDRDLSGATLLASCQPCEMCLATMRWAGIGRVIFAAQQANIADTYFRFPGLGISDYHAACEGCFDFLGGVEEERVAHVYAAKGSA